MAPSTNGNNVTVVGCSSRCRGRTAWIFCLLCRPPPIQTGQHHWISSSNRSISNRSHCPQRRDETAGQDIACTGRQVQYTIITGDQATYELAVAIRDMQVLKIFLSQLVCVRKGLPRRCLVRRLTTTTTTSIYTALLACVNRQNYIMWMCQRLPEELCCSKKAVPCYIYRVSLPGTGNQMQQDTHCHI